MLPLRRILCPTDFSEPSYEALETACELAGCFGAEVVVLHVAATLEGELGIGVKLSDEERAAVRDQLCELIAERVPLKVSGRPLVRQGDAAAEIVRAAEAERAGLIVIATHGRTGWRHLVCGSVAERVLRLAHCPVLIVHVTPAARN